MNPQKHLAISREEESRLRPRHLADVYRAQKKSTEKKGLKTNRCARETLRGPKRSFPKCQQRKFAESLKTSQFLAERKAGRAALYQQRLAENRTRSRKQLRQEERRARNAEGRNITDGRAFFPIRKRQAKKASYRKAMMPFTVQLANSVTKGATIASFRFILHPFYPKPGQTFKARSGNQDLAGTYLCKSRTRTTLGIVKKRHWQQIGVFSEQAYEELMKSILNTRTLDYHKQGYFYIFERVS